MRENLKMFLIIRIFVFKYSTKKSNLKIIMNHKFRDELKKLQAMSPIPVIENEVEITHELDWNKPLARIIILGRKREREEKNINMNIWH